ncbi:MAG: response regulator transcription factor [Ardenticatenales bacterium]|nr:response regulator transcription factor [Ardenticatenales bacterium]
MKQRILVVDDDREIVRLLRGYLTQSGFEVFTATNGETALHTLRREKPDMLLLDLMLPDRDGWDLTRLIRGDSSLAATPIIMITARVEDTDKILGLELGADDYITKPFNPREVVARVRALLRRAQAGGHTPPQVLQLAGLRMDVGQRLVTVDGTAVDLTPTEFDILRLLLENPGYAFTRGELIGQGMGYEYAGMERTLDSHIKNLRRKIEPDPKEPRYIQTVYGIGYKLVGK